MLRFQGLIFTLLIFFLKSFENPWEYLENVVLIPSLLYFVLVWQLRCEKTFSNNTKSLVS